MDGASVYTLYGSYIFASNLTNTTSTGTVNLYGGNVSENVFGASATISDFNSSILNSNTVVIGSVNIYGGSVLGDIYGALGSTTNYDHTSNEVSASATGIVNLSGGVLSKNIYGASVAVYSSDGIAKANATSTITITKDVKFQSTNNDGTIIYNSELWGDI